VTDTTWKIEHLLKNVDDLKRYLEIPDDLLVCDLDCSELKQVEEDLGDSGIVMVDTGDPLCGAADLFSMEEYTVIAMTEPVLFHQLLEKFAIHIHAYTKRLAAEYPGRLWRIYGPEYASEPYLPPRLFREYVCRYTGPMIEEIQKKGGFARFHSHGRLKNILPLIAEMGPAGLDPIEPPPQGDIELIDVRREYGHNMVLFGNLEASDIENLDEDRFRRKVRKALQEGTAGEGRGFVLMPSASPYGRIITSRTQRNYEAMVEEVNR
jgi:uroporphyrinogen-III decarboxylase